MPSYPSTLVQPNSASYSLEPKKNKEEFVSEFGNRRQRRFVTPQVYVVTLRFDLKNKAEYDAFLKWVKYDIDYGNLWFAADFLANEGFTEGEWVWKFVKMSYSATGYSMGFACTMLMAPRYSNIVSDDYVELGIEGSFLNPAIDLECEEFEYQRVYRHNAGLQQLEAYEFNGTNFTHIGTNLTLNTTSTRPSSIACCTPERIAIINGNAGATLGMYEFDGLTYTLLGSSASLVGSTSIIAKRITRMSDSRIAYYDGDLRTIRVYEFNETSWTQIGSDFDISSYLTSGGGHTNSITCLSPTRLAFVYNSIFANSASDARIIAFDFNGSTWSQVGSYLEIYTNESHNFSITAISSSDVVLTHTIVSGGGVAYGRRLTTFSFDGSVWSAGTPSAQYASGGDDELSTITSTRVSITRGMSPQSGIAFHDLIGSIWTPVDNALGVDTGNSTPISSYFEPQ